MLDRTGVRLRASDQIAGLVACAARSGGDRFPAALGVSGNPNDVWDRKRLLPEDAHLEEFRGKFGFSAMIEKRIIERELRAALGREPTMFEIGRQYEKNHANDETYAETSRRLSAKWRAEATGAQVSFTWAELQHLSDHFDGANDPVVIGLLTKVRSALERKP